MKNRLGIVCLIVLMVVLLCGCGRRELYADEIETVDKEEALEVPDEEDSDGTSKMLGKFTEGFTEDIEVGKPLEDEKEIEKSLEEVPGEALEEEEVGTVENEDLGSTRDSVGTNPIENTEESNTVVGIPEGDEDVTASFTDLEFANNVRRHLQIPEDQPILKSQCKGVTELSFKRYVLSEIWWEPFTSLKGIENFEDLESLRIWDFDLEYKLLNAENYPELTKLKNLKLNGVGLTDVCLDGFDNLETLDLTGNSLKSIDIGSCKNLTTLCLDSNISLENVYGLNSGKLRYLSLKGCNVNSLDVSKLPKLQYLNLKNNSLNSITLGNNSDLWYLDVSENLWLDEVSIKNLKKLNSFYASCCSLEKLDARGLKELATLEVVSNTELGKLYLDNKSLAYLDCTNCDLRELDCRKTPSLQTLLCSNNYLKKLEGNCKVEDLDCTNNYISSVKKLVNIKSDKCRLKMSPQYILEKNKSILDTKRLGVIKGSRSKIKVYNTPDGRKLSFKSLNTKVATVDKKGWVTGKKSGIAKVVVTISNAYRSYDKKIICKIRVFDRRQKRLGGVSARRIITDNIKVQWNKIKQADGYEVKTSNSKYFDSPDTEILEVEGNENFLYFSEAKKQYLKVRWYSFKNGYKHYSKWSKPTSVGKWKK